MKNLFPLEQKVLDFLKRNVNTEETLYIIAAVSGGADSSALLTCLQRLSDVLPLKLICAHVNHNLRGSESDRDEAYVRSLCEEYGIPINVLSADVKGYANEHGMSTEEAGRKLRYDFFEKCRHKRKNSFIATAHTLSDSAETFFFNAARGTALAGICGIPPVRGDVIRPLIECTREEIEEYCEELGINYVTDSSNLTDDYSRNKIRHAVIPALKEINPSLEKSLLSLMKTVSETRSYVESEADRLLNEAKSESGYFVSVLKNAPECLKAECAAKILASFGFCVNSERVMELAAAFSKESYRRELSKDRYIVMRSGLIYSETKPVTGKKVKEIPLFEGTFSVTGEKSLEISVFADDLLTGKSKFKNYSSKELLDYDKIQGEAIFRSRKEGDAADIHGGTKTLKKLFNEHHIPLAERNSTVVLADELGVVWVENLGTASRCRVSEKTKKFVGIKIRRQSRLIN